MVAPNGARMGRADHPALPLTIDEIVACARDCAAVGAGGMHAHLRDAKGAHVLDAGLYGELLAELALQLPGFYVQITTEAAGRYAPAAQRALVAAMGPVAASVALREIAAGEDRVVTERFYRDCAAQGADLQHIVYDKADIDHLAELVASNAVAGDAIKVLLVLGRDAGGLPSTPAQVQISAAYLTGLLPTADWALCAFGQAETACLVAARDLGGKARVGFENNLRHPDGTIAATNAARVAALVQAFGGRR